jgi:hypothetical protein
LFFESKYDVAVLSCFERSNLQNKSGIRLDERSCHRHGKGAGCVLLFAAELRVSELFVIFGRFANGPFVIPLKSGVRPVAEQAELTVSDWYL